MVPALVLPLSSTANRKTLYTRRAADMIMKREYCARCSRRSTGCHDTCCPQWTLPAAFVSGKPA